MKLSTRRLLLAAIAVAIAVPLASASAERSHDGPHQGARFKALVFTKTAAFRHTECIPQGTVEDRSAGRAAQLRRGRDRGRKPVQRRQSREVRRRHLPLHDRRRAQRDPAGCVRAVHPRRRRLRRHPLGVRHRVRLGVVRRAGGRVLPRPSGQRQPAVPGGDDERRGPSQAATRKLGKTWTREEEWYNFRTNPRPNVHVLLSVDESTYDPRGYSVPGGSPPMGDHPISWCHRYDGGRAFYTALGHKGVYWDEPLLLSHVLGGIEMAAGAAKFDCD